jgi:serine/threonine protein kinase
VGKGTYGCGFAPALRCQGETVRKVGLFTKLMAKEEADKESEKVAILQPVDPEMKFILYPVKICKVNEEVLGPDNPENNVQSCSLADYPEDLEYSRAVQYMDGGIDLENFVVEAYKVLPIFQSLPNLFLGLYRLHKAGVSHNDIKSGNIVLKELDNGKFITRFIDIGFVHTMSKGISDDDDIPFTANYYPWPYEMRFSISPIKKPTAKSVQEWYEAYKFDMLNYIPYEHFYNSDGSKKFTLVSAQSLLKRFSDQAEREVSAGTQTTIIRDQRVQAKISELVLQKVDTYSLGNTLLYLYNRLIHHRLYKGKIEFYIARTKAFHGVDALEDQGLPGASRKWHQEVATAISKPYIEMCLTMMNLDPAKRRPLPIVLLIYKKIVKKMESYFTKEQIESHIMLWK